MTKKKLTLEEEAARWAQDRPVDAGSWQSAPKAIPRGEESTMISLRVPKRMLVILKEFARREGIGYQVLLKRWLDDRVRHEAGTERFAMSNGVYEIGLRDLMSLEEETCEVCGRVDQPGFMCWRVGHLINKATAKANPEYAMPVETSGWQIPASMVPPPDSFTRQQVEAMLRIALTDRTDEWTIKSVDERVAILLSMFTKEKP